MATAQNIQKFYEVAAKRDFSRDFQFRVAAIEAPGISISEDDLIYAQGGNIPGRTISTTDVPYMGLNFKVPGSATYTGTYPITFYSDRGDTLRQLMLAWTRDTFDDETSTGNYFIPGGDHVVNLIQLDTQLNKVNEFRLVGAFPTEVGDVTYNIQGTGAPVTFDVTLAYHYVTRGE